MGTTTYAFDDQDWQYSFRETKVDASCKAGDGIHAVGKIGPAKDQVCDPERVASCTRNPCITGIVIALPLSLLAWSGIFLLIAFLLGG